MKGFTIIQLAENRDVISLEDSTVIQSNWFKLVQIFYQTQFIIEQPFMPVSMQGWRKQDGNPTRICVIFKRSVIICSGIALTFSFVIIAVLA